VLASTSEFFGSEPYGVFISTNSGASWNSHNLTHASCGAWSADGSTLVVAGADLAVSTDAGSTWVAAGLTNVNWSAVAASAAGSKLVAAASPGLIYTSRDFGASWVTTSAPSNYWSAVASSADGTRLVAVAGRSGIDGGMPIYTSVDSGTTWTSNNVPDTGWISVVSTADGCKLLAAGYGRPYATTGIYAWQTVPEPVLEIAYSGTNLLLSWTVPSMSFVLQQSLSLAEPHWTDVGVEATLNYSTLKNEVGLPIEAGQKFYRLTLR
jgi:hypothetical protein